jgi:hypothetical protein
MADVALIYLPPGEGASKQGVDDYLASGCTIDDLLALATRELRDPLRDEEEGEHPLHYRATASGLVWDKPTQNGPVPTPLTNFTARITADVAEDDGAEVKRSFEIEATLNGRARRFNVPAAKFSGMGWPTEHLGASAIVYPGFSAKDHARAAVQLLSEGIERRRVFAHTGWRKIDGVWLYLHGGGAIGPIEATEGFQVELGEALSLYALPEPPEGEDLRRAIRASLRIWEVAPDGLVVPQHAATYRAAMTESDFSLHVTGQTGEGKSEVAALCLRHYGAELDARNLTSWESTDNALETQAHTLKDSLMVADDFAPSGTSYDVQRWHKKADRIMRGKGNAAGRGRQRADLSLRPPRPPRALILSTGEDTPRGQSLRARMLILEHEEGMVDFQALTRCQEDAREGAYAQAMAGFVSYLARDYKGIQNRLPEERHKLREEASRSGEHKRTPGIVADLGLGLRYFLNFAKDAGAVSREEAEDLWERGWEAIIGAAASQATHQAASEPTVRFLELLSAAIASGRAHVAEVDGGEPEEFTNALGWRRRQTGTDEYEKEEWQPQGDRVGWVKGEDLYLEPEASYRIAQAQTQGGESITIGPRTMRKRLKEKGLLLSTDEKRQTLTVRRTIEGVKDRSVLHLSKHSLFSTYTEPDEPDAEKEDPHKRGNFSPPLSSVHLNPFQEPDAETDEASGPGADRRVQDEEPDAEDTLTDAENPHDRRVRQVSEDADTSQNVEGVRADRLEDPAAREGYELVKTQDRVEAVVAELQDSDIVAVDLETTGLNPRDGKVRLISLATAQDTWLIDCFAVNPRPLFGVLALKRLVIHNGLFDLGFLFEMGFGLGEGGEVIDTMLMSQIVEDKDSEESKEAA